MTQPAKADEMTGTVKLAVYRHFADTGRAPEVEAIAAALSQPPEVILGAYGQLRAERVLLLEPDGRTIRMAPPFSGVPTQHRVESGPIEYFANCAWDALGIPAALGKTAVVHSRCGQTDEALRLEVGVTGPPKSDWVFHCPVPASRWWQDVVFT